MNFRVCLALLLCPLLASCSFRASEPQAADPAAGSGGIDAPMDRTPTGAADLTGATRQDAGTGASTETRTTDPPDSWPAYRVPELGLSLRYPPEWGEPSVKREKGVDGDGEWTPDVGWPECAGTPQDPCERVSVSIGDTVILTSVTPRYAALDQPGDFWWGKVAGWDPGDGFFTRKCAESLGCGESETKQGMAFRSIRDYWTTDGPDGPASTVYVLRSDKNPLYPWIVLSDTGMRSGGSAGESQDADTMLPVVRSIRFE